MKKKWFVLLALGALSCLSSHAEQIDQWMNLNGSGTFCKRLSQNVVMRDPNSCGIDQVYCSAPVQCFTGNTSFVTTVMCRAKKIVPPSDTFAASAVAPRKELSCPTLQRCADDPEPQLAFESDLPKWRIPGWDIVIDDMIFRSEASVHK